MPTHIKKTFHIYFNCPSAIFINNPDHIFALNYIRNNLVREIYKYVRCVAIV